MPFREADIMSEGTRMAAEVFAPKKPQADKLPTIVMSHGWGGTAAALRPDAIAFAQAGTWWSPSTTGAGATAIRGWSLAGQAGEEGRQAHRRGEGGPRGGRSDRPDDRHPERHQLGGRREAVRPGAHRDLGFVVLRRARGVRGRPRPARQGVRQPGRLDGLAAGCSIRQLREAHLRPGRRPDPRRDRLSEAGEKFGTLTGAPLVEKLIGYAPIEDIGRCKNCAKLFIIAENEELFDNKDHAILAHERATGVKKLVTIKGIKHYGIYNEARDQAQKEAIAWFDEHLK